MRGTRAALTLYTTICAALLGVGPAVAHEHEERPEPAGQDTTCHDVLEGKPAYEVKHSTDPSGGAKVRTGDAIAVRMTWEAHDFTDAPLYDVLSCVTVDGVLDETLGVHEEDTPNTGEFTHRFTIPAGLPSGAEVCVRGAIAGDGDGYFERNLTDDECVTVESPEDLTPAPPPAAPIPGSVAPETETAPPAEPAPAEEPEVGGNKFNRADAAPATAPQLQETLPRTGLRRELPMGLAGMLIALGGAFVAISPRRRSGQRTQE